MMTLVWLYPALIYFAGWWAIPFIVGNEVTALLWAYLYKKYYA